MKCSVAIFISIFCIPSFAYKYYAPDHPVHVHGYTRSDGTYVHPYYRARPGEARREADDNPGYGSDTYSDDYDNDDSYDDYDSADSDDHDDPTD